jgi:hypothetical protein
MILSSVRFNQPWMNQTIEVTNVSIGSKCEELNVRKI